MTKKIIDEEKILKKICGCQTPQALFIVFCKAKICPVDSELFIQVSDIYPHALVGVYDPEDIRAEMIAEDIDAWSNEWTEWKQWKSDA
jgi:hypothetical protein